MFAMAVGAGFTCKYRNTSNVAVAVIGDGGMEEGICFEAVNLAARMELPVLFICENNQYSAHTRIDVRSKIDTVTPKVQSFGLPTRIIDGSDAIKASGEIISSLSEVRQGRGPVFIEVMTYRYCGHVGPEDDDVLNYRTVEELSAWRSKDPIKQLKEELFRDQSLNEDSNSQLETSIQDEISLAFSAAKSAAFPDYQLALNVNSSNRISVKEGIGYLNGASSFDGDQRETKLAPY